jgi:hypothetical protein
VSSHRPQGKTIKPLQLKNQWGADAAYDATAIRVPSAEAQNRMVWLSFIGQD